jgi:hypothetical protein
MVALATFSFYDLDGHANSSDDHRSMTHRMTSALNAAPLLPTNAAFAGRFGDRMD